jgi:hypothetical protein
VTGSDAAGLFLNGATGLRASTLYKVTSEGVVEEVTYTDSEGNPTTVTYYPTEVSSPDPSLIFFRFSDGSGYLVKKDDGKAYLLGEYSKALNGYLWITGVQRDFGASEDQISFWGKQYQDDSTYAVVWATFESGSMVKKVMSANGDSVEQFSNDTNGNLVYSSTSNSVLGIKQRNAGGTFSKLAEATRFWATNKGHINVLRDQASDGNYILDQTSGSVLQSDTSKVTKLYFPGNSTYSNISTVSSIDRIYIDDRSNQSSACAATAAKISSCGTGNTKIYTLTSNNPLTAVSEADAYDEFEIRYDSTGFISSKERANDYLSVYSDSNGWQQMGQLTLDFDQYFIFDSGTFPFNCRINNIGVQLDTNYKYLKLINEDTMSIDAYGFKGRTQPVCAGSLLYAVGDDEKIYAFNVETKTSSVISIDGVLDITSFQVSGPDTIAVQGHLTDGSSFFGNVDSKGNLTVISKLATGSISIIAPLN